MIYVDNFEHRLPYKPLKKSINFKSEKNYVD